MTTTELRPTPTSDARHTQTLVVAVLDLLAAAPLLVFGLYAAFYAATADDSTGSALGGFFALAAAVPGIALAIGASAALMLRHRRPEAALVSAAAPPAALTALVVFWFLPW